MATKVLLAVAILGAAACLAAADEAAPAHFGGGYGGSYGKGYTLYETGTPFTVPGSDNGVTAGQTAVYTVDLSYSKGGPKVGSAAWTGVYISNAQGSAALVNWAVTVTFTAQSKWGGSTSATVTGAGVGGGVTNTARATYVVTGATGIKAKDGATLTYDNGVYTISSSW